MIKIIWNSELTRIVSPYVEENITFDITLNDWGISSKKVNHYVKWYNLEEEIEHLRSET